MGNKENIPDVLFLDKHTSYGWVGVLEEYLLIKPMMPKTVVIYMVSSSVERCFKAKSISALSGYMVKPISAKT
jgi:AmiR/NasT family two-component response regulator